MRRRLKRAARALALGVSLVSATTPAPVLEFSRLQVRQLLASDLRLSTDYVIRWLNFQPGAVQLTMAQFLQESDARVKLILAARGWSKSEITRIYVAWRLLRNPDLKVLVISATKGRAKSWVGGLKVIISTCEPFAPLRRQRGQHSTHRWSKTEIDVGPCMPRDAASVTATGVDSQITGAHVDLIVLDDIEIPKNSRTEALRQQLLERWDELKVVLNPPVTLLDGGKAIDPPEFVAVGTYQSLHSIYRQIESADNCDLLRIPALDASGDSTFPEKFPTEVLLKVKAEVSPLFWELQMMLNSDVGELLGARPIRLSDLVVNDEAWRRCPLDLYLDPSGCTGNDEFGYCAAGLLDHDFMYAHEWGGLNGSVMSVCKDIAEICRDYNIRRIIAESNIPGWNSTKLEIRRALSAAGLRQVGIVEDPSSGNKHARIVGTLSPGTQAQRVVTHSASYNDPRNQEQVEWLTWDSLPPESIGDDRLDVLQIAFRNVARKFRNPMAWQSLDPTVSDQARRRALGYGYGAEAADRAATDFARSERSALRSTKRAARTMTG